MGHSNEAQFEAATLAGKITWFDGRRDVDSAQLEPRSNLHQNAYDLQLADQDLKLDRIADSVGLRSLSTNL